jgi:hypothetical protein
MYLPVFSKSRTISIKRFGALNRPSGISLNKTQGDLQAIT